MSSDFTTLSDYNDFLNLGKMTVFSSIFEMREDGDDINIIDFEMLIEEKIKTLDEKNMIQLKLGQLSAYEYLKELIETVDLNKIEYETLLRITMNQFIQKEMLEYAVGLLELESVFKNSLKNEFSISENDYSTSKLINDIRKVESNLKIFIRSKYKNLKNLHNEFPDLCREADFKRTQDEPGIIKHEFDDTVEFFTFGDTLQILVRKNNEWAEIPKYLIDYFYKIKKIRNISAHYTGENLENDLSSDELMLGKIYSKRILNFFDKKNLK